MLQPTALRKFAASLIMPGLCFPDQDSVRLLAVQCCGSLARTLSRAECQNTVVPIVQRFAQVCIILRLPFNIYLSCLALKVQAAAVCRNKSLREGLLLKLSATFRTNHGECDTMWRSSCMFSALPWAQRHQGSDVPSVP